MPNSAHAHLIFVHAAPAFLWASLLVYLFAHWFPKEIGLRLASLLLVLIAAIGLVVAANTGEGAVDVLRGDPLVDGEVVHEHEELGELVFPLAVVSAFMVLVWFVRSRNHRPVRHDWAWWAGLVLLLVTTAITTYTGHLGGRIRHPEILPGWSATDAENSTTFDNTDHGVDTEMTAPDSLSP